MYVVSREEIIPISALSSGEKQIPCLPLQPKREELSNNGQGYIEKVGELFDKAISELKQPESLRLENIDESNAYLHIQGHQLYKLILQIYQENILKFLQQTI